MATPACEEKRRFAVKHIAIDCVPIQPGRGGTGSGIWTYARELLVHMNSVANEEIRISILLHREQLPSLLSLTKLEPVIVPNWGRNAILRLLWVHVLLPIWCAIHRVDAIHKLATEPPFLSPCARITTIHDFYHEFIAQQEIKSPGLAARYFQWITRVALKKSKHIITGSATIAADIRARCKKGIPITVVHHGVAAGQAHTRQSGDKSRTILCVAKLMPYKGQMQALEAFARFRQNNPELSRNVRLCLHGFANDPLYVEALDQRMAQADLSGFVERRTYDAEATLDQIYAGAYALLFLTEYEGFGLPVIEAQARGIPVICSEIPVLREVGGDSPWYVDRDDPERVAQAIAQMMGDDAERNRRITSGIENSKSYSWEKAADETFQVYRRQCGIEAEPVVCRNR